MSTLDSGTCILAKTTLGSAAKVLRLSQSAASVLRTSDFYENSSVIDSSITRSLLISDKIIKYDSPLFPDWHRSQHQISTSGNLYAPTNVGVDWRVMPYNIYRISKLLARYTRTNSKNMRFAARSQHSSSDRSTFAAPQVVSAKIRGLEINNYVMIRVSVKSQNLSPNIREDILILRNVFFWTKKNPFW